jgi:hypothetical protein
MAILAQRPGGCGALRGQALPASKGPVLALDWRSVIHRLWIISGCKSSWTPPTGHGPAHVFAYQLAYGVIARLGWSGVEDAVICHQCDFAGCTNPEHMRLGTHASNRAEYFTSRKNLASPLADVRGAAGRTRAIAAAIRAGLAHNEDTTSMEKRIRAAERAGCPLTLW